MTYVGEDGKEYQPYMVHRALLGSLERFFGALIEHYARGLPGLVEPGAGGADPHRRAAPGVRPLSWPIA